MLYLTCTIINSVDLVHYGVSCAKDWESVDCGTSIYISAYGSFEKTGRHVEISFHFNSAPKTLSFRLEHQKQ